MLTTYTLSNSNIIHNVGSNSSGQLGLGFSNTITTLINMINSTGKTPSQIACGNSYTIVLMTDGTIYGTGSNSSGQLGDGTTSSKSILTLMINSTGKTPSQIACGSSHTIVLMTDGTIYGTGSNGSGQLGDGTTTSKNILTLMTMPTGKTPSQIACGDNHTIVLMTDGTIYGTGSNGSGQLGDGTTTSKNILTLMTMPTGKTPSQIACGSSHTIVLMTDGTIYGAGFNTSGQLGDGTTTSKRILTEMINTTGKTPSRIACGSSHTIVLMTDGTIYGTGLNGSGQLGDGTNTNKSNLTLMTNSTGKTPLRIACGSSYTIVLMTDGTIYGTGSNSSGQLGDGTTTNKNILTLMNNSTGKTPSQIACGSSHTIVLMTDGTIYGTGNNGSGQLGVLSMLNNLPTLPTGKTPSRIACGGSHTIVLMTDGTIYGTGSNGSGQLGDETTTSKSILTLMINTTGKTPSQIACGDNHTIVLMTDGTIYGTGNNNSGQLGDGTTTNKNTLTLMYNFTGKTPSQIACGSSHTIVLMTDGTIYGTGNNFAGQLGNGTNTSLYILTLMTNSTGKTPSRIACGNSFTIVLMTDGTIYGTGNNDDGQLGDGMTARRTILTFMFNSTGKTPSQIACGSSHTIVLMTDGTIYGTGNNGLGQLGDGTTARRTILTEMTNFTGKTPSQIACGSSHTIVLMTDGTVYGTGNNGSGQLGDGTTTNKNTLTLTTFNNMKYIMNNNLLDTPTLSNFSVPPKTFGDSSFNLVDPSSNSNGAFSYTSSNTSVATIVGRTVTIVGAGTSVITATQAATINYTSASTTANFLVNPATPTLSNFSVLSKTFGDTPFPITQPTSNSSGALSYTSSNASVATIVGNNVTIVGAGTSLITATQEASGNYTEGTIDASFQVLSNTPSNPVDVTSGEQFMYFLYSPAQYAGIENDITVVENLTNQSTDKKTILNISDTIVEIIKSLGI